MVQQHHRNVVQPSSPLLSGVSGNARNSRLHILFNCQTSQMGKLVKAAIKWPNESSFLGSAY